MARRKADNPVKNPDQLQPGDYVVLQPGDQVQTPYGLGKVKSVALVVHVFEDQKKPAELNPPQITVTLQETGQEVTVCLCELSVPNAQVDEVLKRDYARLWPPFEETVPEADDVALSVAFLKKERRLEVARVRNLVKRGILTFSQGKRRLAAFKRVRTVNQLADFKEVVGSSQRVADTYWNGKGRYQDIYTELWDRLVPSQGRASTTAGELLRSISKIYYDYYNNGFGNGPWTSELNILRGFRPDIDDKSNGAFGPFYDLFKDTNFGEEQVSSWNEKEFETLLDAMVDGVVLVAQELDQARRNK